MKKIKVKQHDITDCGAACLVSIAAHHRLKLPIARIRQLANTDKKGTNVMGMIQAANKIGFTAKGVKGPFDSLFKIPLPAIAHMVLKNGLHHYVVLYKAADKYIEIMDPADGRLHRLTHQEFQTQWSGILILLAPGEEFTARTETVSVTSRFLFLLKPHRSTLFQVLFGAVIYTILGLSTAIFVQKVVDQVLPNENLNLLNLMGLIMVVLLLLQFFINHSKTIFTLKSGQQIDARLILGYYKHLLRLPQQFFDTMRVGEIISRINDAVKIRTFINDVLVNFAVNVFIVIFSFLLMFTYYWKLALIMVVLIPIYGIIYYISDRLNKKTQRALMEHSADLETQLVESVNAAGTIKRFGLEDFANIKTENRFIKLLQTVYRSSVNALWITNSSSFFSGLFTVILLWAGANFVIEGHITPGELLSFYAIIGYFTSPVSSLIGMNRSIQDAVIAADRLFEIMDLEREEEENKAILYPEDIGDITFKDVTFRYGSRAPVFEHLHLQIKKGHITAIVGESGSGKTTILSLLQRIYPIEEGGIFIGQLDIKYITIESLRQSIAVVPQQIDLFAGNVIDNIAVGDLSPNINRIIEICTVLGMMPFIEKLPGGFNTYLGENGTALSGGQRQRLAIARALYRNPEILILDEATSSLDSSSEQHIQEAVNQLRSQGKTIILIAHRLSTVINADKIIVMQNGQVIEEGGHRELMEKRAAYYAMWKPQTPFLEDNVI
ncbi:MAG: peptidase domain-containing ABC transporter [Pseudosphingobacterium sp.]|uniref:peptidase domain-containing ABC transporter n=1 Tax=Olivibacter jilunii TaxID=985016 RepID=UPI0029B9F179|nr:peptidase domain-containing ABC transporter [Olivibacter sp. UJ_SKK_5.1]MDX3912766.1 peptidase domain-containing ABC transporter [Pseudosphingobacterium sp.]